MNTDTLTPRTEGAAHAADAQFQAGRRIAAIERSDDGVLGVWRSANGGQRWMTGKSFDEVVDRDTQSL